MFSLISFRFWHRAISVILILCLTISPEFSYAQSLFVSALPEPGTMLGTSAAFTPVLVRGLVIHPDKPLNFDFIVDSGNEVVNKVAIKEQSERIAKYFLAAVTVPESQLWVNLSPYEKDRIIDEGLGQTLLGRDMLAQDYVLKQLTASMIYPEDKLGKDFWTRIYKEAQEKFGTSDIPVDTFNKVWITPEKAEIYEKGNVVYVTQARLKVMLDSDYQAMAQNDVIPSPQGVGSQNDKTAFTKEIIRQIVLPAIEKEVNEGKNFATLRQVYYAAILAKWYRGLVQDTLMTKGYIGQNKIAGVTNADKTLKEQIYQRYIAAYKKGVFNYIKEESDVTTGETIPRKYFSGGLDKFGDGIPISHAPNASMITAIGKWFRSLFVVRSEEKTKRIGTVILERAQVGEDPWEKRQKKIRPIYFNQFDAAILSFKHGSNYDLVNFLATGFRILGAKETEGIDDGGWWKEFPQRIPMIIKQLTADELVILANSLSSTILSDRILPVFDGWNMFLGAELVSSAPSGDLILTDEIRRLFQVKKIVSGREDMLIDATEVAGNSEIPLSIKGLIKIRGIIDSGKDFYLQKETYKDLRHSGDPIYAQYEVDVTKYSIGVRNAAQNGDIKIIGIKGQIKRSDASMTIPGSVNWYIKRLGEFNTEVRKKAMAAIDRKVTDPKKKLLLFESTLSSRIPMEREDVRLWVMSGIDALAIEPDRRLLVLQM